MKEVCVDARMVQHSGIGTYIRNLLPYLKDAFPSLRVLAPFSLIEKWPHLAKFDLIPLNWPPYSIQEQFQLPLRIPSCDLFWSPHYNIPLLPIRTKKRVVTIHDVYHLAFNHTLSIPKKLYAKMMMSAAVSYSDQVITISQFSKDEIIKYTHVSPQKVSVIHLGINRDQFTLSPGANDVKVLYKLPARYFIFVSTLAPHKNLTRLLKAWNQVTQSYPDWTLVVVGKQSSNVDYLQVFDLFPHLKLKVRFLGEVEMADLPSLYQEAYAAISPSLYEGFGLTPLEAMAMGCPTVVSQVASLPEVCGDASLYVNPHDEGDIAKKIILLIEDPSLRKSLFQKGKERVELFEWKKTAQAHIELMCQPRK